MSFSELSNEEKRRIANERQNAVRKAWRCESDRIKIGKGTREWTEEEQKQILERGSARGYEGHHMKSVSLYPQYAGEPRNIQFLTEEEHLYGAHNGSYHNLTNGYYDPYEEKMVEFEGDELPNIPEFKLNNYQQTTLKEEIYKNYMSTGNIIQQDNNREETHIANKQSNGYEVQ